MKTDNTIKELKELFDKEIKKLPIEYQTFLTEQNKNTEFHYTQKETQITINENVLNFLSLDNDGNGFNLGRNFTSKQRSVSTIYKRQYEGLNFDADSKFYYIGMHINGKLYGPYFVFTLDSISIIFWYLQGKEISKEEFQQYLQSQKNILLESHYFIKDLVEIVYDFL